MLEEYVVKQNRRLRCGYTTGSSAAAAAGAAAEMLLGGEDISCTELMTPKGILLKLDVEAAVRGEGFVSCGVRKDGGDDPDVTDGLLICARVEYAGGSEGPGAIPSTAQAKGPGAVLGTAQAEGPESASGDVRGAASEDVQGAAPEGFPESSPTEGTRVVIDGGEGVGRVTLPGLEQPVGAAAINRVPRRMIREAVLERCRAHGFRGCLRVTVFVPGGGEIGKRTFNPRIGIIGGISILGTTGIVEPMSESALIRSIKVEMKVQLERGNGYLVVIPGNYGAVFSRNELGIDAGRAMKCSNFIGETVDFAAELGAKGLLLIGHIGKFVKLSGGIMNTHSRNADSRMELLAAAAIGAGAPLPVLSEVLLGTTTDEGLRILKDAGYLEDAMGILTERAGFYLQARADSNFRTEAEGKLRTEVMIFSNVYGLLGQTEGAAELLATFAKSGHKI